MLYDFMNQIGPNMAANNALDFSNVGMQLNPMQQMFPMMDAAVPNVTPGYATTQNPEFGMGPTNNLTNGIMPGEWDWMNNANFTGKNNINPAAFQALQGMGAGAAAPSQVGGGNANNPVNGGAPKMTEWIQRQLSQVPSLGG